MPESTQLTLGVPTARLLMFLDHAGDSLIREYSSKQGQVAADRVGRDAELIAQTGADEDWQRAATRPIRARISSVRSISRSWLTSRAIRSPTYESKKCCLRLAVGRATASGNRP